MLIDGNSLVYRAYFATAYSKAGILTNNNGQPVNAILAFTRMINKLLDKYSPTHLLISFDYGKKTKRHDKLPSYKEGRSATPKELLEQLPLIKEMLTLMNIKHHQEEGVEADDIIGSATKKYKEAKSFVVSSDKDMLQLSEEGVDIIIPQNGAKADVIITANNFKDHFEYSADQVTDFKAISGDSSDNIPGVPGIGPKGAIKLLNEFETVENLYAKISKVKQDKLREKLIKNKANVILYKEIATIQRDENVPYKIQELELGEISSEKLVEFFEKLQLNSLVKLFRGRLPKKEQNYSKLML